jgi:hypothetical protein
MGWTMGEFKVLSYFQIGCALILNESLRSHASHLREAKQQDEVLGSKSTEQIQSAAEEEPLKEKESPDMSGNEDAKEEVVEEKAQEEKNKEDLPSVTAEVAATSDCAAGADAPKGFGLGFGGFQSSATANNNSEGGGFFGFTTAASSNPFTSLVQGDGGGWGSSSSAAAPQVEEAPDEKKESVQGLLNPSDVVNGEEGEDCVLQLRAKLYRLDSEKATGDGDDGATAAVTSEVPPKQEWKEVGTGPVRVLRQKGGAAERLVMRRENHPGGVGTKVSRCCMNNGRMAAVTPRP